MLSIFLALTIGFKFAGDRRRHGQEPARPSGFRSGLRSTTRASLRPRLRPSGPAGSSSYRPRPPANSETDGDSHCWLPNSFWLINCFFRLMNWDSVKIADFERRLVGSPGRHYHGKGRWKREAPTTAGAAATTARHPHPPLLTDHNFHRIFTQPKRNQFTQPKTI